MEQVKAVEGLFRAERLTEDDIFKQPEWLAKMGVTMLPADDLKVGRFGFVLFDGKKHESWSVRQAWPKAKEVEHKRFHVMVKALSDFVERDVMCLKCHDLKNLRIGFLAFRGSGVEWHFSFLKAVKAWRRGAGKAVKV